MRKQPGAMAAGRLLALVLVMAGAGGCAHGRAEVLEQRNERYDFRLKAAADEGERAVTGSAAVVDRASGRMLYASRFTAPFGTTSWVAVDDSETDTRLEVAVTVDAEGRSATYDATVKRAEQPVAKHRETLPVRR